jgi:iron(III) transport system substrate-binding protein
MDIFVQAFNTEKVKREELPKSYRDLLDPRWKGRLGIEAEDQIWFGAITRELGGASGVKLFREIAETNGFSARKGHTLLANLVAAGEIPLALTVYNYKPAQLKDKGGKIDWFIIPPAIAQLRSVGVSAKSRHPSAALLFVDFMLSDAQPMLASRHFIPANAKIASELGDTPIAFVDPAQALDKYDAWTREWQEAVIQRAATK